jgi:hypothetical protein
MDDINLPFSLQSFELQAAANALTCRVAEHIRCQSPEFRTTNDPMVQKLHEERRQLWNTIEELERERSRLISLVAVRRGDPDTMAVFENKI